MSNEETFKQVEAQPNYSLKDKLNAKYFRFLGDSGNVVGMADISSKWTNHNIGGDVFAVGLIIRSSSYLINLAKNKNDIQQKEIYHELVGSAMMGFGIGALSSFSPEMGILGLISFMTGHLFASKTSKIFRDSIESN